MVVSDEQVMAAVNEFCALMEDEAGEFHAMRAALEAVFSVDAWEHRTGERTLDDGTEERRPVLVGPWVRCDEQPDFVDEMEAEIAARRPVPVQQDEPEDDHWHWLDDRTGRIYHEGDVFGVRSGRDVTLHRLRCTCDPVPEWIVDNAEAKGWDLSPEAAPLPRTRPPRSHRDDESLRRWEARHPSVRFPPTTPLLQDGWCDGSGRLPDPSEYWPKNTRKCPSCDGRGCTVPVQQDEPEDYPGSFVRGDFALCWNTGNLEVHDGKSHTALCEADAQALSRWLIAVLPVQQDEPEACDHVWRSSFGDTFCEKCNQDFASDGEGSSADPGSPPARQTAAGSQPSPVPVQQDEPEGVCAFPNCSCTENRCPAKGERGPFCDHGFHPRLCGRCAPVPEAVTDEDEVQCQMCKTVQPRPDKECGHCGAGPKYLCPIHTRPAAVPVQQERSVRAPKTDDPHSLPRVDDLLDDIPVQQEPGR